MKDRKDKIVIISILVFVFAFLFLTGTVTSGYHFVDDHEVIKINSDLKTSSLNSVAQNWVKVDMKDNLRFRPFYYFHRVYETAVLGTDFFKWSLYTGLLWYLTLALFYLAVRNMKFSYAESLLFLIITFIGPQSSVWWRLGPGESLGMFLFALVFYFMSKALRRKFYQIYNLLFIIFLILSSLTKESFLLIIPAIIVFKIWNERIYLWSSVKESIFKNLILLIPLAVCMIELYIIKKYIGTSYAGLDAGIMNTLRDIIHTTLHFIRTYLNILIAGLVILIICFRIKKFPLKFELLPVIFFFLVLIPNIILYSKSGLVERYLLPSTLALGFLIISVVHSIKDNPTWLKKLVSGLLIISFLPYMANSISQAFKFSKEGRSTNNLLSAVQANQVKGLGVLVVVDPVASYETSVSLKTYLYYEDSIDLFGFAIPKDEPDPEYQGYVDGWKSYFEGRLFDKMTTTPGLLVFLDNKLVDEFFQKSKLSKDSFVVVDLGNSPFALLKAKI